MKAGPQLATTGSAERRIRVRVAGRDAGERGDPSLADAESMRGTCAAESSIDVCVSALPAERTRTVDPFRQNQLMKSYRS